MWWKVDFAIDEKGLVSLHFSLLLRPINLINDDLVEVNETSESLLLPSHLSFFVLVLIQG